MIKTDVRFPELGTLPYKKTMKKLSQEILRYVKRIFSSRGEGKWKVRRDGKPATLRGIVQTLRSEYTSDTASVRALYTIHQYGGQMVKTQKQTNFFWAKYYETKKPMYKWMALTKKPLQFPQRMYMYLNDSDLQQLSEQYGITLTKHIFTEKLK